MKCGFCGDEIRRGTGLMYAKMDGTVYNFCSKRCMKYMLNKKNPKKLKWASKRKNVAAKTA